MKSMFVAAGIAAGITLSSVLAQAATPPKPKISSHQAEKIAAAKMHGKAMSAKYEFEDGRWQYAVIVTRGKEMYEVEVNSTNGKVMDTERTTAAEEAKEAAADKAKAMGGAHASAMKHASPAAESDEKGEKGEKGEAGETH